MKEYNITKDNQQKRYEKMYNQKKFSDIKIKFEKSGNIINAHKLMLSHNSVFFQGLFLQKSDLSEYLVDKNENENIFTDFIFFLYTGKVKCKVDTVFLNYCFKVNI
jgi:hypothetical protein